MQTLRRDFDQMSANYNRTQSGLVSEVVSVAGKYTYNGLESRLLSNLEIAEK